MQSESGVARPNILIFMPDQLRPDWIGPGNRGGARTPNADALAARGVCFDAAVCPSPICGPSRASLATGYEYDRCSVPNNRFSVGLDEPNLYRQLARAGYQVLTCGKLDLLKGELDWGADGQHAVGGRSRLAALGFTGGLDSGGKHAVLMAHRAGAAEPYLEFLRARSLAEAHVADFAGRRNPGLGADAETHPGAGANFRNTAASPLPDDAYQDDWIGDRGIDLVRAAAVRPQPWFLQVNFAGPHEPMNVTATMRASVAGREPPPPAGAAGEEADLHREIRRNYTAMVERLDAILGRFVATLAETGQLERTVVVVTSDHGEMLGDCGLWEKFVPHQPSIGIPLIVAGPGVARGRAAAPVSFLDLHATAIELASAEAIPGTDSRSLVPLLADPAAPHREAVFSGLGSWRVAFDGRHKLVAGYDRHAARREMEEARFDPAAMGGAILVEPARDPCEIRDLSAERPEVAARLRALLAANAARPRQVAAAVPGTA
jgi:arylsulfatase A-like enzyme